MPGLEVPFRDAVNAVGGDLVTGSAVSWLTGRGHAEEIVQTTAPDRVLRALADMHEALGGDADALANKRRGNRPTPDLIHRPTGCIVEVDEVQHFTTARLETFRHYPPDTVLGFEVEQYRSLITQWRSRADRAYAHRVAADFPQPGGRQAQRAYNDALRDLLAPVFTGHPVLRVPVPDRHLDSAVTTLAARLPSGPSGTACQRSVGRAR